MIPNADMVAKERLRHHSASKGPTFTFLCGKCRQGRRITGRRKVGSKWHCAPCVAAPAEGEK